MAHSKPHGCATRGGSQWCSQCGWCSQYFFSIFQPYLTVNSQIHRTGITAPAIDWLPYAATSCSVPCHQPKGEERACVLCSWLFVLLMSDFHAPSHDVTCFVLMGLDHCYVKIANPVFALDPVKGSCLLAQGLSQDLIQSSCCLGLVPLLSSKLLHV